VKAYEQLGERSGVLPCIDGTWMATCPHCRQTVIWLEQSQAKVRDALLAHACNPPPDWWDALVSCTQAMGWLAVMCRHLRPEDRGALADELEQRLQELRGPR
jgi:hypothetical protein